MEYPISGENSLIPPTQIRQYPIMSALLSQHPTKREYLGTSFSSHQYLRTLTVPSLREGQRRPDRL